MQDSSLRNSVNHTANMTDGHDTIDRTHIHTQRKRKKKLKEGRKKERKHPTHNSFCLDQEQPRRARIVVCGGFWWLARETKMKRTPHVKVMEREKEYED